MKKFLYKINLCYYASNETFVYKKRNLLGVKLMPRYNTLISIDLGVSEDAMQWRLIRTGNRISASYAA